jgi:transposase InsO family protein
VVERIVQIRQAPPENLQRVAGSRTILYYLHRDPELQAQGLRLPRSARTIWKILRKLGLILDPPGARHQPLPPREPLEEVQIDFKDITTVPADPDGKQQHGVETCNFIDAGTSILLEAQLRDDFRAQTAFDTVVQFLHHYGMPRQFTFDRDPRWVGAQSSRDFPSAKLCFLLCLGIEPHVCPPHQPQKNAFVERYHRSYKYECVLVHRPGTLQEAMAVTKGYQEHYNWQRPHQGRSCRNLPPRLAFPELPRLPELPREVDPDRWLERLHGQAYVRHIGSDGCVTVDERPYYVGLDQKGKTVALLVDAVSRSFEVS